MRGVWHATIPDNAMTPIAVAYGAPLSLPYYWRKPIPSWSPNTQFLIPTISLLCQVVSVRAPAATDGRPTPNACCLARSKAVTVPKAYQAHTQPSHLFRRPPPLGSF